MRLLIVGLAMLVTAVSAAAQTVQVLHRFSPSPSTPNGPLLQVPDGSFYGVTTTGIIRLTTGGQATQVARFRHETPVGGLVRTADGALYGATQTLQRRGTIFRFDPVTGDLRTVHEFQGAAEGRDPLGGLVAVGGSLYGATRYGPGLATNGTIFHVVVATGEVVTDHAFTNSPTPFSIPVSPLTLGSDGLLYGTAGGGNLYRFDPATTAVTRLREFSLAEGSGPGELVLGADGSLYGSASRGGLEGAGTIFRYTPATGLFQRLYSLTPSNGLDGRAPGPLVAGGDGHFYGVTDAPNNGGFFPPSAGTVFRLRAGAGGTFTYETLRVLDRAVDGRPSQVRLTLGADGLIYGYAQFDGPTLAGTDSQAVLGGPTGSQKTGTLFRFDPAESGPPSNPIAFTVVHAFPLITRWDPSRPVLAADGLLYGTLNAGGASNRGAVYRLNPGTSTVTVLGDIPGTRVDRVQQALFVAGTDGLLYGISASFAPSPGENSVIRVDPTTGTATIVGPTLLRDLTRTPAGVLFGSSGAVGMPLLFRYDPSTNVALTLAQLNGVNAMTPVVATTDGQVYVVAQRPVSLTFTQFQRTFLIRPNAASPTGVDEILVGDGIEGLDRLVEGADGVLYLGARFGSAAGVLAIDRTTGTRRSVCAVAPLPYFSVEHLSLGPDGALYGIVKGGSQRLFRCDPSNGAVTLTALPPDLGRVVGPLTSVGEMLYGAAAAPWPSQGGVLFRIAVGGTLPALDSDGDGLPNTWESTYRLDPFATGNGDGAGDDPDGDGRTNAQELADGTHPRGFFSRLFAEGNTGPFFRTRFDVTAPGMDAAVVRARFLTDAGTTVATDLTLSSYSHVDVDPATLPGLGGANFSAIFESDAAVAVDRTMSWDASGYGSHLETGIAAASTTWFFAEGSTSGEFALFYLLQNPQATPVTATVTYLRPFGQPTILRSYVLPPSSRTTIAVDNETAELASTDVSASISATAPIVAERAMYLSRPGQVFAAGHESAGVTTPALEWFLAEGATGTFFDLFVLIANPSATAAAVEVEYLRTTGGSLTKTYTVPAHSRMTIWVDDEEFPIGSGLKPLAAASVSTVVRATNGVPIVVERAMWWPGPETTSSYWYEAHNSPGTTGAAPRWVIGGADLGGPDGADTYILIANPGATAAIATVQVIGDVQSIGAISVNVAAKSRVTVSLRALFPMPPAEARVGVVVDTGEANPVPIVVERATYASPGGVFWSRGGNALASPLP